MFFIHLCVSFYLLHIPDIYNQHLFGVMMILNTEIYLED